MSWNFKDGEEVKREYEFSGTVTISTTEYRDLIEDVEKWKRKAEKENSDWHEEYYKRSDLESKLKTCEQELSELKDWLDSDESLRPKFRLWKIEKSEKGE